MVGTLRRPAKLTVSLSALTFEGWNTNPDALVSRSRRHTAHLDSRVDLLSVELEGRGAWRERVEFTREMAFPRHVT